jgi:hypothetical protein
LLDLVGLVLSEQLCSSVRLSIELKFFFVFLFIAAAEAASPPLVMLVQIKGAAGHLPRQSCLFGILAAQISLEFLVLHGRFYPPVFFSPAPALGSSLDLFLVAVPALERSGPSRPARLSVPCRTGVCCREVFVSAGCSRSDFIVLFFPCSIAPRSVLACPSRVLLGDFTAVTAPRSVLLLCSFPAREFYLRAGSVSLSAR